ncbi:MAG: hypothetical protein A3D24_03590 [Candidatus Blackburnbacteria bacterium RIFCSPHIGHO2_02_FULL_39_13]|uniref:Intein C-terminal splicing domain-containing protein n=1 Tax=Candidatus Blackburnbacteria bacterium RIFCSPLOWO2_01_FULL_40_20 TaxID=1797519 RepID=A0A1G1VF39_9BACT|nr:MAG: hypothetical protein A3D24_03590 [Candidatus Blackburnbacteria bacterium RIFCSPHIGHO2_02_FULL_39_13]OGY13832.1 MAG: hypothetical protein A3A77_03580 [Candidatus Blackburnbacteria bacterium RIFCSPLOWO2_01_FULL_40_20]
MEIEYSSKHKGNFLLVLLSSLLVLLTSVSLNINSSPVSLGDNESDGIRTTGSSSEQVLGKSSYSPSIYISGGREGYGSGGLVSLALTDDPSVDITSYYYSGNAKVDLYEANQDTLFDYLVHDKDGNQINKNINVSGLNKVVSFNQEISSSVNKMTLPLSESGMWALRVNTGSSTEYAFIVRSKTGAIVKEGDNEYIFWVQDYKTKRSVSSGSVKIFNLTGQKSEVASIDINEDGIAKTSLTSDADIALVENNGDRAIIPINLRYLNSRYGFYKPFNPKSKQTKYFVFTDRPIYRPGDTVYYKAILREDDDARYTIPSGSAKVKISQSYEDKDLLLDKDISISQTGTISGEYKLPEDANTGYYNLRVQIPEQATNYWVGGNGSFQVEYYRKPEFTIDLNTQAKELIAGDKGYAKITGNYFSGQPISNQKVKYKILSSNFYEYQYLTDHNYFLNDEYRYTFWNTGEKNIVENEVNFTNKGDAAVDFVAKIPEDSKGKTQVYSIETEFDDGTGNPSFARKNILIHSGEFGIYRTDNKYATKIGEKYGLPVVLAKNRETNIANVSLAAKVHRTTWIQTFTAGKKYPDYNKEEEDYQDIGAKTDKNGNATLVFTPPKEGSYTFTVQGKDRIGNLVAKDFTVWATDYGQPFYADQNSSGIKVSSDKSKYNPGETANLTILSDTPDRDVFLSLERARVDRFSVIRINGKSATTQIKIEDTDTPNIFVAASSFSTNSLEKDVLNVPVSTDSKKLMVKLITDKTKYAPGDRVKVKVQTTDLNGKPIFADTALWAVDKAIFELTDNKLGSIFDAFWSARYDDTQDAHSLEGITVLTAEMGGCFDGNTPILMGDGSTKSIKDVKVGQEILTRKSDRDTSLVKAKVLGVHKQTSKGYLIINGTLKVTPNHKLFVNNKWMNAENVQTGDNLHDPNGRGVKVSSVAYQAGKFDVYNLQIDKYKTFFADGIWVHNQKGGAGRSVFKDTAYWNPQVTTDQNGQAEVEFTIPDNLTTWVVTSVGDTQDTKVGQSIAEVVVQKDLVVSPILPNIFRSEDKNIVSALIHNFTDKDRNISAELSFDGGGVDFDTKKSLRVSAGSLEQVYWSISPKEEKEKSKLILSAMSDDGLRDSVQSEVPVKKFGFIEKSAESGVGDKTYSLGLFADSDKPKSEATLFLAQSSLGTLTSAIAYLVNYPYGCVEQITSSIAPAIIVRANPTLFSEVLKDKNVDDIINKGIKKLKATQRGGWSWYGTDFGGDPFITAYVTDYLVQAKNTGIKVDDDIFKNVKSYFEQEQTYNSESQQNEGWERDAQIVRIYTLSLIGSSKGKVLLQDFSGITPDLLAMAVMANGRNGYTDPNINGLNKLVSMAHEQGETVYWDEGSDNYFGSKEASTALAIRAILGVKGDRDLVLRATKYLTRLRKYDYWANTFGTSQVIQALTEYAKVSAEVSPDYTYSVLLDGKQIAQGIVTDLNTPINEITIPVNLAKTDSKLEVKKNGEGELYSTLVLNQFRTDRGLKAESRGLSVKREYINDKGSEYSIAAGDVVRVDLTVSGLSTDRNYVVVTDELPSGLIPINNSFKNQQYQQNALDQTYGISNMDVTENGAVLTVYKLPGFTKTYSYKARVVNAGEFVAPPATVSLMYSPEVSGRSDVQKLSVSQESKVNVVGGLWKNIIKFLREWDIFIGIGVTLLAIIAGTAILYKKKLRKTSSSDNS